MSISASVTVCYLCGTRHPPEMKITNVFDGIPEELPNELVEVLSAGLEMRIERLVSRGHCSPPDFWYDQADDEWVYLVAGRARLQFADDPKLVDLTAGDCLRIPAHARHRVDWTDPEEDTIWLAVFSRSANYTVQQTDEKGRP